MTANQDQTRHPAGRMERISVSIQSEVRRRLKLIAERDERSEAFVARQAIEAFVEARWSEQATLFDAANPAPREETP